VLDDGLGAGELEVVLGGLESGVGDLAVVDDDSEALGAALLVSPADALGEPGLGVGEEELDIVLKPDQSTGFGEKEHTMSSLVTWLALPQALMT
jgi:hypothetical protein